MGGDAYRGRRRAADRLRFCSSSLALDAGWRVAAATRTIRHERGSRPSGLPVPRYVSLKFDPVNARSGRSQRRPPPAVRLSRASGLPVQVVAETTEWRRICDLGRGRCPGVQPAHHRWAGARWSRWASPRRWPLLAQPQATGPSRGRLFWRRGRSPSFGPLRQGLVQACGWDAARRLGRRQDQPSGAYRTRRSRPQTRRATPPAPE